MTPFYLDRMSDIAGLHLLLAQYLANQLGGNV